MRLVEAFVSQNLQSELLYLLEPHVLKHLESFTPHAVIKMTKGYIRLNQGSSLFLDQMVTYSAIVAHKVDHKDCIYLFSSLRKLPRHTAAVKLMIENNLLKNIDKVNESEMINVIQTLEVHGISKPILYDLLAT